MVVLNGSGAALDGWAARLDFARLDMDQARAVCADVGAVGSDGGPDEGWYYVSSRDRYVRRIESRTPGSGRLNHIVLWVENVAGVINGGGALAAGCELGSRTGPDAVSVSYGPGADPARAAITVGTASIVFDPRTIAEVIVWTRDPRSGQSRQGRYTWDHAARGGVGAFVLAGPASAGKQPGLGGDAR